MARGKTVAHERANPPLRRAPGGDLDAHDIAELDKILVDVESLYRV